MKYRLLHCSNLNETDSVWQSPSLLLHRIGILIFEYWSRVRLLHRRHRLRTRKLCFIYGDILRNLEQMDVERSIGPDNNQVPRNLYAIKALVITVVDLGGIKIGRAHV